MNRKYGISFLILCFVFSNVNLGWATESIEISPVVVQPYEIQQLNQQMLDRDRRNRDQEIDIQNLVERNKELAQSNLANKQDQSLAKINQTMLSYQDALLSRDRARIVANGEKAWNSRYGDLIALTEDTDDITVHQELVAKNGLLADKYQMLTELKDEMTTLNDQLEHQQVDTVNQKDATIEGFKKIAQEQQDKIQILVNRLGDMDQRINHLDDVITAKDLQIAKLRERLLILQHESVVKDETIKEQENQIAVLQGAPKVPEIPVKTFSNRVALPPIIVNEGSNKQLVLQEAMLVAKDKIIKQQAYLITTLEKQNKNIPYNPEKRLELPPIIINSPSNQQQAVSGISPAVVAAKDQIIKQQEDQISILKEQAQDLTAKEQLIKSQADQMTLASQQFKNQSSVFAKVEYQVRALKNRMMAQSSDLKAKNEKIRWLGQVLAATRNKAQYYQLTTQQDKLAMRQVQGEVQNIKEDFAQHFKDYGQFENAIVSLKAQVNGLSAQLTEKQQQVDSLKADLQVSQSKQKQIDALRLQILDILKEENRQGRQGSRIQQHLKNMLQEKENQITKMKADIREILQAQANKEIYRRNAAAQVDDRIKLAKQLIGLQQEQAELLDEKSNLEEVQNIRFDQYAMRLESKIKQLLVRHQIQTAKLQDRMNELKNELDQKIQQVGMLNAELKFKIGEENNQAVLQDQIQDLKGQLQVKEDQIAAMKNDIVNGQKTQEELDNLKVQLATAQDKADQLKEELEGKAAQSDQMTAIVDGYQKKLEMKDNAYNLQLKKLLSSQNHQALMKKQIAFLYTQLHQKEAQVAKIKMDMADLQDLSSIKNADNQVHDLSQSADQQKTMALSIKEYQDKIDGMQATNVKQLERITQLRNELSLARQQMVAVPSSDEMEFLRDGLKKATAELKQKDAVLAQIKTNAQEYEKEFKEQTQEFQSLKDQLQDAQEEVNHKNDDLKYKDLAMVRYKKLNQKSERDLKAQVRSLTRKFNAVEKQLMSKTHGDRVKALQDQLAKANIEIKNLKEQLKEFKSSTRNDALEDKLSQALDKIDQQGQTISTLAQKLEECTKGPENNKDSGK